MFNPSCLVADMNHNNDVDIPKLVSSGKCFAVIHKATQGVGFTDNKYRARHDAFRAAGLLTGAYDFNVSDDIAADVNHFFEVAQPDAQDAMCLDYERNASRDMTWMEMLEFLDRGDQKLGRPLMIYGGDKIKRDIVHLNDKQREFLAQHPLWGCEYGPGWRNVDVNGKTLPWDAPILWQYSADGYTGPGPSTLPGLEEGADLSMFDGTPEGLRSIWPTLIKPAAAVA